MKSAYLKDILRGVRKNGKRFLSILTITALGVAVLTGIYAACQDMYYSSDQFYDAQKLFDIRVRSTLGLTEDDVAALRKVDGVLAADGGYGEFVHTEVNGVSMTAEVIVLSGQGLNQPLLTDGHLPERQNEIAVTQKYIDESHHSIGDMITIKPDSEQDNDEQSEQYTGSDDDATDWDFKGFDPDADESSSALQTMELTITGIVIDPMNISNNTGKAFRSNESSDFTFFVSPAAVDTEIYTSVYLLLRGFQDLDCFSDEYGQRSSEVIGYIEDEIVKQREKARYEAVVQEAHEKIGDAENTMLEKFAEADGEFDVAWFEIEKARLELQNGRFTLTLEEQGALMKLDEARRELEDGKRKLLDSEREIINGQMEIDDNEQKIIDGRIELNDKKAEAEKAFAEAEAIFAEKFAELREQREILNDGVEKLKLMFGADWPEDQWNALVMAADSKTTELLADNPQIAETAMLSKVTEATGSEQAAIKSKVPSPDMAKQVTDAGVGLGMTQASIRFLEESARIIADSKAILEAQITSLESSITAVQADVQALTDNLGRAWPQVEWDSLTKAASQKAVALLESNPLIDSNDLAASIFVETIPYQEALATGMQDSDLAGQAIQAAINLGMLTGSKQFVVSQKYGLERTEQEMTAKLQILSAALAQLDAGVAQMKLLFGCDWPQKEWNSAVSAAAKETVRQLNKDNNVDPDDLVYYIAEETETEISELRSSIPDILADDMTNAAVGLGILRGSQSFLDGQMFAYEAKKTDSLKQMEDARLELIEGGLALEEGKRELEEGRIKIEEGRKELEDGEVKLIEEEREALKQIAEAWAELSDGEQELETGKAELIDNEKEYLNKKTEAEQKIADAYSKLNDIDMTQWYVQDRTSIDSYSSLKSDLSSIQAVGTAFPVVFLLVAVLISLTTMTRLVEEERSLIGTYKALGFTNFEICKKYLSYALFASFLGGILGNILGFIVLPFFLLKILSALYEIPGLTLRFDAIYGGGGALLFLVGIVGSTYLTCRKELLHTPASLMRPKSPRAGSRVILERIPFIWNNMGFLNKVTARNIFRYKKRMLMTVTGIMGCTALVLSGFAIRDSVRDLEPKQYEKIIKYDLMAVASRNDEDILFDYLKKQTEISDFLITQLEMVKVYNKDGLSESVQMFVIPAGAILEQYISTMCQDGKSVQLSDDGIFLTQNAAEILGLNERDEVLIQTQKLDRFNVTVSRIVENYLGNYIFITEKLYIALLQDFKPNAALARYADSAQNSALYAQEIMENDFVMSTVSTQVVKEEFSGNFAVVNSVVYLLTALAAGLAFVVLFTLSGTNISERQRELATIKVLGFFDREVHTYVNKETLILTLLGVLLGLPAGRFVSGLLTEALKMPGLYFAIYINPGTYLIAGLISFSFALSVNLITNRTLDKIDMVEALKSVE